MGKGFIKVVEAVIASIIVLASLSYFFGYYVRPSEWDNAQIKLQSQDILNTMDDKIVDYMKTGNPSDLRDTIQNMASERIGFSINVVGAPPPRILIACVKCTDDELNDLTNRTDPMSSYQDARGRRISVAINKVSSFAVVTKDMDIMFIYGYGKINSDSERQNIKNYLDAGGNVILFSELTQAQIDDENNDFLKTVFGLESVGSNSLVSRFYNPTTSGSATAKVYYYYSAIYTANAQPANPLSIDTSNVAVDDDTIVYDSSSSAVHAQKYYGNGRAVWFNYYDKDHRTMTNGDSNDLLKSIIMWSAEDFTIVPEPVFTLTLPKSYFTTSYIFSIVNSAFNMYKVKMTMWYIY